MSASVQSYGYTDPASDVYGGTQQKATGAAKKLGQDEFIQLLVAQLQNQDPMNPVKNEDFIAQMATFNSLEQLVAIKEGVNKLAGITDDGTEGEGTNSNNSVEETKG